MKRLFLLLILIINSKQACSQYKLKEDDQWYYLVQPVLDSISKSENKKIYYYRCSILKERRILSNDSILKNFYNLDSSDIHCIYESWEINRGYLTKMWYKGISNKKKYKLEKKWDKNKSIIATISLPIFIKKDVYLLEVTYHCPGLCGSTYLYFIRIDKINKKFKVEYVKNFGGA